MTSPAGDLSQIAGILFDKDGTLLDFYATWIPKGRALLAKLCDGDVTLMLRLMSLVGYDMHTNNIISGSILAAGNNLQIAQLWAKELKLPVAELEVTINAEFANATTPPSVAVDNLTVTLQRLQQMGYILGVATMDSEQGINTSMASFDCLHLFDFLAGYDSGYGSKPGPGMVQGFCQVMSLRPEQVMVVGDNTHDMHMGLSAGAGAVVGVLTGTSAAADLHEADYVLDSIADLPALLA
ncbi:MAG: HAD family hydrolase [Gammaproteobacteria bacterium]|jgi:phosphoglycolate phosphatase|nr:HAD family hydrolase [Gammaproteobacteria bacterium]